MSRLLPSTIVASTRERLDFQWKNWEKHEYVRPPEFDAEFDRLMNDQTPSGYAHNGLPWHDDWKS